MEKELSFNNMRYGLAWKVVSEFKDEIACCAVKHSTPCGVAVAENIKKAYEKVYESDPISIFGGIVAFNRSRFRNSKAIRKNILRNNNCS